jgi:hypothetical protein
MTVERTIRAFPFCFKSDLTPRGAIYTRFAGYIFAGQEGA